MSRYIGPERKFVVRVKDKFMAISDEGVIWVAEPHKANVYPSRYAAKKHVKLIDGEMKYELQAVW